ncbi:MAG TPA: hypothetical protein VG708_10885 [Mycobacteriales bacterium]|nr:hypothetical protein [Mycobacteriales bacterium]
MRRRLAAAALCAATAATAAGCGGGTPTDLGFTPAPVTHSPHASQVHQIGQLRRSLTTAVKQYSAAYFGGNVAQVKALTSHRCLILLGHKQLASRVGAVSASGGKLKPGSIKITAISPTNATVTAKYLIPKPQPLTEHWVRAKSWRDDDC